MINKLVLEALSSLQVPVGFQKYSGKEATYVTFHEYYGGGEGFEDDEELMTAHYIQVDVWSKTDYSECVNDMKAALAAKGFKRLNEADLYEPDTETYHKGMKFYYLEAKEEN